MKEIIKSSLPKAMTYSEYRKLLDDLHAEGKTTGPNQTEMYLRHAGLNLKRIQRLDKTGKLIEELTSILDNLKRKYIFLTITEGWCGDAAQNLPLIEKMAQYTDRIEHKLLLRDENLELMDEYLTDGGRSIPKVIILDAETGEELGDWGPRPVDIQQMVMDYKHTPEPKEPYDDFSVKVHSWYAKNKAKDLQMEFVELFKKFEA
ncbi:MAG: thioredoxin family protein [Bacteroidia bacterium]|nr:thioredoxin family protein [Bacteroidia bacterium]